MFDQRFKGMLVLNVFEQKEATVYRCSIESLFRKNSLFILNKKKQPFKDVLLNNCSEKLHMFILNKKKQPFKVFYWITVPKKFTFIFNKKSNRLMVFYWIAVKNIHIFAVYNN